MSAATSAAVRALGASAGGASASRLLALLYDPDVDIDRLLQCLHGEPVLAARVLKVANSPYYGQSGRVGSVQRALQLLGLTAIRGIAAAGALDRLLPSKTGNPFDPVRFRRHSGAVACAAQALSRQAGCGVDSEAFLAGLLHDIGILLLVKADPAAVASYRPDASCLPAEEAALEVRHFGLSHEEAGALLIDAWALPAWLKQAVATHHLALEEPAAAAPLTGLAAIPALVAVADRLADLAGYGQWPRCAGLVEPAMLARLGMEPQQLQAVIDGLEPAVAALGMDA
ncbi:MAG: HDOD domain-containing protein [Rubrivivax sp.]|nr:HDOD domain-containing protein [Rubrivivax sp.]